jgi:imidazolonepropionase-like amidohydrolase
MARTIFQNANLLDGENPPVAGATVVVIGDRIAGVYPAGPDVSISEDDVVVDLAGRSLVPGLITTHFHSTYTDLGSIPAPFGLDRPVPYQALLAARNLATALRCGYTGAVSAAASHEIDASMAQAIDDGVIEGPRLVPGSRELSSTGHSNDGGPWWWKVEAPGATRLVDGADAVRFAVRDEIKRGARVIKLYVTGGHGVASPRDQMEMTRDEVATAIDTAHSRGALVRGHIANKRAILMAVELGMDIIDHADGMDQECIAALVENGTFVVPSIRLPEVFLAHLEGTDPDAAKAMRADLEESYEAIARADEAGVLLTVGDDYGALGLPHGAYADELLSYTNNVGIPTLRVLRWATKHGAAMMRRSHDLGTVEEGKLADLVVVDGDPSADISALSPANIVCVLKSGQPVSGTLPGQSARPARGLVAPLPPAGSTMSVGWTGD